MDNKRMLARLDALVYARKVDGADKDRTKPHLVKPVPLAPKVDEHRDDLSRVPIRIAHAKEPAKLVLDVTNELGNPAGVRLYAGKFLYKPRPTCAVDNGVPLSLPSRDVTPDYDVALDRLAETEGDEYVPAPHVPEPRWYTWPGRVPRYQ